MHPDILPKLFEGRVTTPEQGCWEWQGCRTPAGYGQVRVNNLLWLAHRYAYASCVASIPEDLIIMHACDNPACVRPSHLRLGTHRQNMLDKEAKGHGNAGAANGQAKLSAVDVETIRELFARGTSQAELGRMYKVNRSCIWKIVHRTHWSKYP